MLGLRRVPRSIPRFETDERFIRVVTLVVDPGAASAGSAKALLAEVERVGARRGRRVPRGHRRATTGRTRASCSSPWATTPPSRRTSASGPDAPPSGPAIPPMTLPPAPAPRRGRGPARPAVGAAARRWQATGHAFRELPVGPSRHLVRFLVADGARVRAQGAAERRRRDASTTSCATSRRRACRRCAPSASRSGPSAATRSS